MSKPGTSALSVGSVHTMRVSDGSAVSFGNGGNDLQTRATCLLACGIHPPWISWSRGSNDQGALRIRQIHGALWVGLPRPTGGIASVSQESRERAPTASSATSHTVGAARLLDGTTYGNEGGSTKAGTSIEPVIVAKLVDLDALFVCRLMRHCLCHHQRFVVPRGDNRTQVDDEVRSEGEILLRWRDTCLGLEESKSTLTLCALSISGVGLVPGSKLSHQTRQGDKAQQEVTSKKLRLLTLHGAVKQHQMEVR